MNSTQTDALSWEDLQSRLRQLERRDWRLWGASVAVMLLLTAAVVAASLPTLMNGEKGSAWNSLLEVSLTQGIRGLAALVLLFNLHLIYQQLLIQRLRRDLARQISSTASTQIRADDLHRQLLDKQKRDVALSRSIDTLSSIVEATKQLNSTLDFGELINIVLQLATRHTNADRGTMFLVDKEHQEIWSLVGLGLAQEEIRIPIGKGIAGRVATTGETVNLSDAYQDPRFDSEVDRRLGYRSQSLLCLPIRNKGNDIVGVLQLLNKKTGPFDIEDTHFLRALSIHCAIAIENAQLHQMAMHDPLTGLYNRRFIEEHMVKEFARSKRREYPLTLLTVDLNKFKEINDQYGHAAGDLVLKEFANHLKRACRGSDLAARLGGDEFMLLLTECLPGQVPIVLSRLTGLEVDIGELKIPVTFAAGWAEYEAGERPAELLKRADKTLYAEKRSGKVDDGTRRAQRVESLGQLAGGVAHDLSNLLMVIRSYSELALDDTSLGEILRKHLQEIQKASERATTLTRQLLSYSRKQALSPELLSLNSEVIGAQQMLARLISQPVLVQTELEPSLGFTKADRAQIEQVILNLVFNARDAMPDGGTLTIATRNIEMDDSFVAAHPGSRKGSYVSLSIRDTGCGMDAETKARIFEPFFTTKGDGRGTGLGLATVYGIVKQSAGYIWVESAPGRGSAFTVYLPRHISGASATA